VVKTQEIMDFVFSDNEVGEIDIEMEQWKKMKSDNRKRFQAMQNLPHVVKVKRAEQRGNRIYIRDG